VVLAEAAHSLVLAVQWTDVQCSSRLCGEYEPSKIWKIGENGLNKTKGIKTRMELKF
jgi:hypothetical protein